MTRPITPQEFDAITASLDSRVMSRDTPIWTAKAIAARIGTSVDFVTDTLANEPGTPIRKIGGRYCCLESELMAFFGRQAS